jgi:demethylmenaquinone methyltransferase / 2-methoxy-6-polyprenyl-1,4-benzoquinol methylase
LRIFRITDTCLNKTIDTPLPYQHPERIRKMFGSIAQRYDLANHVLSCGIDFYWRKRASEIVAGWKAEKILDLATGTGDLALALQDRIPGAEVIGVDFVPDMVELARRKGVHQAVVGDAMNLSFPDGSFDCVTIAFGLRNLPDYAGGLREMARILKRNRHVLILEFSIPTLSILRGPYRFYLHRCLPLIGSILTRHKEAYDYLGDSIEKFPSGEAMRVLLEASGFTNATAVPLTGGIVTIHTAEKS